MHGAQTCSVSCSIFKPLFPTFRRKLTVGVVSGTTALILATLYGTRRRRSRKLEDKRVATLVQEVFGALKKQETAHYVDPVTYAEPYLSSLQLRDIVLQRETSVAARRRLWDRVERIVESNANVRTNLQEVAGGDEMRVWRWIGGTNHELELPGPEAEEGVSQNEEE
jgi:hypothetical protein